MQLTIEQRQKIIFLHFYRLGPKLNIRKIAKELKYSKTIVKKQIIRYQDIGDVLDEEKQGRKRKTSEVKNLDITSITKRLRISSSAKISILISKQKIDISPATVRRKLNEQGLYKL